MSFKCPAFNIIVLLFQLCCRINKTDSLNSKYKFYMKLWNNKKVAHFTGKCGTFFTDDQLEVTRWGAFCTPQWLPVAKLAPS